VDPQALEERKETMVKQDHQDHQEKSGLWGGKENGEKRARKVIQVLLGNVEQPGEEGQQDSEENEVYKESRGNKGQRDLPAEQAIAVLPRQPLRTF